MSNGCIVCGRTLPLGETKFCCPGCSAVFSIIEKLNLEGSEKDERISQLLEGVFPEEKILILTIMNLIVGTLYPFN